MSTFCQVAEDIHTKGIRLSGMDFELPEEFNDEGDLDDVLEWNELLSTLFVPLGRWGMALALADSRGYWIVVGGTFRFIAHDSDTFITELLTGDPKILFVVDPYNIVRQNRRNTYR